MATGRASYGIGNEHTIEGRRPYYLLDIRARGVAMKRMMIFLAFGVLSMTVTVTGIDQTADCYGNYR